MFSLDPSMKLALLQKPHDTDDYNGEQDMRDVVGAFDGDPLNYLPLNRLALAHDSELDVVSNGIRLAHEREDVQ